MTAPTVTPDQIAADLREAATWVRRGWCIGTMANPATGAVCTIGAIATAIYGKPPLSGTVDRAFDSGLLNRGQRARWYAAENAVNDYMARNGMFDPTAGVPVVEATDWNDMRCPDGEQAARVLEACAAELDGLVADPGCAKRGKRGA
jgi:hypothetical protein